MALHLPGTVPFVVYNTQDNTTSHYAHVRIGNDAAVYLQFIVDYYDCLPEHMAFIHAQQMDVDTSKVTESSAMHAVWQTSSACRYMGCKACTVSILVSDRICHIYHMCIRHM